MEQLHGGYTLNLCEGAFPLSTDSMLLAHFVRLPRNANVLDLGAGCGTLGLLLCAKDSGCKVTGIELDSAAHETALQNISSNHLSSRMQSICADLSHISSFLPPNSFSCCVSNPPYFSAGQVSKNTPLARHDHQCSIEDLFQAAAWSLKYGGDFFLVHKPQRLAELFHSACKVKLEPKQITLVRHQPDSPMSIVLVQCRKGAKPGLIWHDLCLFDQDGNATPEYQKIYHI